MPTIAIGSSEAVARRRFGAAPRSAPETCERSSLATAAGVG